MFLYSSPYNLQLLVPHEFASVKTPLMIGAVQIEIILKTTIQAENTRKSVFFIIFILIFIEFIY